MNYVGRVLVVEAWFGKSAFEFPSGKKLLQIAYHVHGVTFVYDVPQLGAVPRRACPLLCLPASTKQDPDLYCFVNASLSCCLFLSLFPFCVCNPKGVGFPGRLALSRLGVQQLQGLISLE